MDRALYIAMSGAKQNVVSQTAHSNNLANASTTGFRSDYTQSRAQPVFGDHFPTRAFAMAERPASDLSQGPLQQTGRQMDVAIKGPGWFVVEGADGEEAYTRAGDLSVDPQGRLINARGLQMMGDGGPIVLPPFETIEIGRDGTISIRPQGEGAAAVAEVVQLRLVNPDGKTLAKGTDGLFRIRDRQPGDPGANIDPNMSLVNGFVEGSNVNAVTELTQVLAMNRQYEMQIKLMKTADENSAAATQLLSAQ
ncbi:MAG: flagellar basal-body rod protein FlgF [Oleispira sp.]|jgi:flagellar basal-body rod protein FlgF